MVTIQLDNSQCNAKNGLNSHKINLFCRTNNDKGLELRTQNINFLGQ